jgi:hypothetical protein
MVKIALHVRRIARHELFSGHFDAGNIDPSSAKVEAIVEVTLAISHDAAYITQSWSSVDGMQELYRNKHNIDVVVGA